MTFQRIGVLTLVFAATATAAFAQDRLSPAATPSADSAAYGAAATTGMAPSAPVGHRQPAPANLPVAVRQDETAAAPRAVDPLGPLPQICKAC